MTLTNEEIAEITVQVKSILQPYLNKIQAELDLILEVHKLMGLDYDHPLFVTQTERIADTIQQTIIQNVASKKTTIIRE